MILEFLAGAVLGWLNAAVDLLPAMTFEFPDISSFVGLLNMLDMVLPIGYMLDLMVLTVQVLVVIYGFRFLMWAKGHLPVIGGSSS